VEKDIQNNVKGICSDAEHNEHVVRKRDSTEEQKYYSTPNDLYQEEGEESQTVPKYPETCPSVRGELDDVSLDTQEQ